MHQKLKRKITEIAPDFGENLLPKIRKEFSISNKTILVLDDDPTGTQTCSNVHVLTSWEESLLIEELEKKPEILFILTNSRSFPEKEAKKLAKKIGKNLKSASQKANRSLIVISRSDSTLRGHYPIEVDALAKSLNLEDAIQILVPAFIEGQRFTIDDSHFIVEDEELIPVSETAFAKDVVFGYQNANLKKWVEEKTKGKVKKEQVKSISLNDIRIGGPDKVSSLLNNFPSGSICIANALSYRDLEVLAFSVLQSERKFLFRSSATLVPILAGFESGKAYVPKKDNVLSGTGSLTIVGSHVPKSTRQLNFLLAQKTHKALEINIGELLDSEDVPAMAEFFIRRIEDWLSENQKVLIYTSRILVTGKDDKSNLKINSIASKFLVRILKKIKIRPKYIIAKGGITSSDIASKGLSAQKALILGAVIPGVPVWQLGSESKFPGINYVVFPGNVGDDKALNTVIDKFEHTN